MRVELLRKETTVLLTLVFRLMAPDRRKDLYHLMLVLLTPVFRLMAPDKREDLYHLMFVLLTPVFRLMAPDRRKDLYHLMLVLLTPVFRLMAPDKREDLYHLMFVLLRCFCQCCINRDITRNMVIKPMLSTWERLNGIIRKHVPKQRFIKL